MRGSVWIGAIVPLAIAGLGLACEPAGRCDETPPIIPAAAWARVVPVAFPFAAADLPSAAYIATHGHLGYACAPDDPEDGGCSLDLSGRRWDPADQRLTRLGDGGGATVDEPFADDVLWEAPVRSPVAGRVIACWRGMPDDDDDGDDVNCPGGAKLCTAAGNFVTILSDEGFIVSLAHLRTESVPPELCPIDERYLYADDPKPCALGSPWAGFRERSLLGRRGLAEPTIAVGDLVGRVGASGSGKGIHLHIHAKPHAHDGVDHCEGPSLPIAFDGVSVARPCDGDDPADAAWTPLDGDVPPIDGELLLFAPAEAAP